jgi:hypothetical protein
MAYSDLKLYERIDLKFEQLETKHVKQQAMRDVVCQLFRPDLGIETDTGSDGDFFGENIFEGTASWAARVMATSLQGKMISKNIDWIMYVMTQFELRGIDKLDIWCQDIKDHMVSVYERSNIYQVLPNYTLNGVTIGSPVMFGEENNPIDGRIMWMPQHYKHTYVSYDKFNEVDGVVIKDPNWTVKQIYDTFCQGNTEEKRAKLREEKLSKAINTAFEAGEYSQEFTIFRAVFKIDDPLWYDWKNKPKGNFKWLSVYFEGSTAPATGWNTDRDKDMPLNDDVGYFSRPFVVWDYDKKPWQAISRTPATYAIYDTQSQNQVFKQFIENIQGKNRPATVYLHQMKNRLQNNMGPEGMIGVTEQEYAFPPKALDLIGDVNLQRELFDMMSDNVKRWFHIPEYQKFTMLSKENKQPVTALQILQMMGESITMLSPEIEACDNNLQQIDARTMDIEIQAGHGPFDRNTLANITDIVLSNSKVPVRTIGVSPRLTGLLARAQKTQQVVNSIQMSLETAAPLLNLYPDLRLAIKEYGTLDDIFTATGFPKKDLKTEEDYQALVDAVNEARSKQLQTAQTIELMKASKSIQGKVEPDSILAGAGKVLAGAA